MNIGLDATPLSLSTGGIRRYTEELARALVEQDSEDHVVLLSDQSFHTDLRAPNLQIQKDRPSGLVSRRWWSIGIHAQMRKYQVDVFHGTNFAVPYLPLRPAVLTLHDLSPWMDPGWHSDAKRVRKRTPLLVRSRAATMVIVPTAAVRNAALQRFGLTSSRVVAVPEAAAEVFRPSTPWAHPVPYFVIVGTMEPRKNLPTAVEVWRELRKSNQVDLLIAGRARIDAPEISPEPGLHFLGELDDCQLSQLYSGAVASLYPSFYEGFGLPVLEAMSCGAAVITSRDHAILEVSGGAALHVEALDHTGWLHAMELLLRNEQERRARQELSLQRASQFSWRNTARLTRDVYSEAIKRFQR